MPSHRYNPDQDYYDLLDIPATASPADVRRAFHEQAKACHPDRNVDRLDWANETFQALNEAYRVLSDPALRRNYDRQRWPHVTPSAPESTAQTASFQRAHWNYANLEENQSVATAPSMEGGHPLQTLLALLRGPFGKVYLLTAVMFLMLPLAALVISDLAESAQRQTCPDPQARITEPAAGAEVSAEISIQGTAQADPFAGYTVELLYLGALVEAEQPAVVAHYDGEDPVASGILFENAELTAGPGTYLIRLTVRPADKPALAPCERRVRLPDDE